MAQYVFLYRSSDSSTVSPAEMQQRMQKWMTWMKALADKGHLKDRGHPLERVGGKVVRKKDVTDGPFAEKDLVLGFSIIEAANENEAAELARSCPGIEFGGLVEVRPIMPFNM
jgi:hypothetical protein